MHPDYETVVVSIEGSPTGEQLDELTEAMNVWQDEYVKHIFQVAEQLGVSDGVATDIVYLRGRSRWTQEKENQLVNAAKVGLPLPNVLSGDDEDWYA